jgi:hypothetical protein
MVAACADPARIRVTKSIVGDPLTGSGNLQSVTASEDDAITFAIVVENVGGESISVDVADTFDSVFIGEGTDDAVTWTRTNPNASTTTGEGNIAHTVTLAAGEKVSWLVETQYAPTACTSLTVNIVSVVLDAEACCDEGTVYAWAKVYNADGPRPKVDPTEGWTAMEALFFLLEGASLADKVIIGKFINGCGTLADLIGASGTGGDGVGVAINDVFGDPTGLYAETTPGF